jgi:hypothetical protein
MVHHLSFAVVDLSRAAAFYDAVLSPLGYVSIWTHEPGAGYKEAAVGTAYPVPRTNLRSGFAPKEASCQVRVSTLLLGRVLERLCPLSIGRRLNRAAAIMEEWDRIRNMVRIILPLSFSTLTDIVLKRLSMNIEVRAREYQNPSEFPTSTRRLPKLCSHGGFA